MLKTVLAILALATIVVVVSCSSTASKSKADAGDASYECPISSLGGNTPSCYRACDDSTTVPVNGTCPAGYKYFPVWCYDIGDGRPANTCGDDAGSDAKSDAADAQTDVPDASGDAQADTSATCPPYSWMVGNTPSCYQECTNSATAPVNGTCPAGYKYYPFTCYQAGDGFFIPPSCRYDAGDAHADVPAGS